MIDPGLFTVDGILRAFLGEANRPWIAQAEIVPEYMPPHARPDTRPKCVVRYDFTDPRDGKKDACFLRYSKGPEQGHFWDVYGDDYMRPTLALRALLEAPAPPPAFGRYFCAKIQIPMVPMARKGATGGG